MLTCIDAETGNGGTGGELPVSNHAWRRSSNRGRAQHWAHRPFGRSCSWHSSCICAFQNSCSQACFCLSLTASIRRCVSDKGWCCKSLFYITPIHAVPCMRCRGHCSTWLHLSRRGHARLQCTFFRAVYLAHLAILPTWRLWLLPSCFVCRLQLGLSQP